MRLGSQNSKKLSRKQGCNNENSLFSVIWKEGVKRFLEDIAEKKNVFASLQRLYGL